MLLVSVCVTYRKINFTASENIMSAVENALTNSQYKFKEGNSKIISGKQEAGSAWTTANFLNSNETVFKVEPCFCFQF